MPWGALLLRFVHTEVVLSIEAPSPGLLNRRDGRGQVNDRGRGGGRGHVRGYERREGVHGGRIHRPRDFFGRRVHYHCDDRAPGPPGGSVYEEWAVTPQDRMFMLLTHRAKMLVDTGRRHIRGSVSKKLYSRTLICVGSSMKLEPQQNLLVLISTWKWWWCCPSACSSS